MQFLKNNFCLHFIFRIHFQKKYLLLLEIKKYNSYFNLYLQLRETKIIYL